MGLENDASKLEESWGGAWWEGKKVLDIKHSEEWLGLRGKGFWMGVED